MQESGNKDDELGWKPALFRRNSPSERARFSKLITARQPRVVDALERQLTDLAVARLRAKNTPAGALQQAKEDIRAGESQEQFGTWVYYPWKNSVISVLPVHLYRELRLDRNRHKITEAEQQRLSQRCVAISGMSVGRAILMTLALEGIGTRFRVADYDALDLSNLNRLRSSVLDLGVNKSVLAARELFELDPYLEVQIFEDGITESNLDVFLRGADVLVEECDDLAMKVRLRESARALGVPVVMETTDRGMLDLERFDTEPNRPLFHGLLGDISASQLAGLSNKDKVPFALGILDDKRLSQRMAGSLVEIEQTTYSWPQLASDVALGGALAANAVRRIFLGDLTCSGRFYIDLAALVTNQSAVVLSETAPVAPEVTDESTHKRTQPAEPPVASPGAVPTSDQWRFMLEHAILAPSGGNNQPWHFRLTGDELFCELDPVRGQGGFLDYKSCGSRLAIGAAVKNLELAARSIGFEVKVLPSEPAAETPVTGTPATDNEVVARVRCVGGASGEPCNVPLRPFVPLRVTNRRVVRQPEPLSDERSSELTDIARSVGLNLRIARTAEELREIATQLGVIDKLRCQSQASHAELMGELRWTPEEVRGTRTGLDLVSLELSHADVAGLRVMSRWDVAQFTREISGGDALLRTAAKAIPGCSGVALFSMPDRGDFFFEGGRRLQEVWLECTARSIAWQPWAAILGLYARVQAGGESLSDGESAQIRRVHGRLSSFSHPESAGRLLFVARLLDAPGPPSAHSLRLPLSAVTTGLKGAV